MDDYSSPLLEKSPISRLNLYSVRQVLELSRIENHAQGKVVFTFGADDPYTFFLLQGAMQLKTRDGHTTQVSAADQAALYPLGNLKPRQFTACVASKNATLARISSEILDKLVTWSQISSSGQLEIRGYQLGEEEEGTDWLPRLLSTKTMLRVPVANLDRMLQRLDDRYVTRGEVICKQGDPGDYYYIVARGRFQVSRTSLAGDVVLGQVGPGEIFGEQALISGMERNATVTALEDGWLKTLNHREFERILIPPMLNWIGWSEARELIKQGAVPLDVRTEEEYANDGKKWAINLPLYLIKLKLGLNSKKLQSGRQYVVFCDTGQRSSVAAYMLSQADLDSYVVEGGLGALAAQHAESTS